MQIDRGWNSGILVVFSFCNSTMETWKCTDERQTVNNAKPLCKCIYCISRVKVQMFFETTPVGYFVMRKVLLCFFRPMESLCK